MYWDFGDQDLLKNLTSILSTLETTTEPLEIDKVLSTSLVFFILMIIKRVEKSSDLSSNISFAVHLLKTLLDHSKNNTVMIGPNLPH